MKIGLFFGSFNPVHNGHMIIANYMAEFTDLQEVWMVVSPFNPLKPAGTLLQEYHRLQLTELAIGDYKKIKASKVEFALPKPSYTIHTLQHLKEKFPGHEFTVILGSDTLATLDQWKNYEEILEHYTFYIYPRHKETGGKFSDHPSVKWIDAPLVEISSSFIRKSIREKKDVRFMIPDPAYRYLDEMNFYSR